MSDGLGHPVVKRRHRLSVRFRKVDGVIDTVANIEPRRGNAANNFAFTIFTDEIRAALDKHGYDLSTMKFHIDRKQSEIEAWEQGER